MSVDALHPAYEEWSPSWAKCRHAFDGPRVIKSADFRSTYLPPLEEQQTSEYHDYVDRAQWFPATERTVKGLAGAVLRTETKVEVPSVMEDHLEDITLTGIDIHGFASKVLTDQVLIGRCGGLVEMPEEESEDQRPYWTTWTAERVTNWGTTRLFGQQKLVLVVLQEDAWTPKGEFEWEKVPFYRVLQLVPIATGDLRYRQTIWVRRKDGSGKDEWVPDREIWPMRRGVFLDEIPFAFFGATSTEPKVQKSPSLDLVEINYGMYRNSADYEIALSAIRPLYALAGYPASTQVVLGPKRVLISEKPAAELRAEILQGADPVGLRHAIEEKRLDLRAAGGRLLEGPPKTNETAEAVRIRHEGEEATLRTISQTMGLGLQQMLKYHATWVGGDPDAVEVQPNQDFVSARLSAQDIQAYTGLVQEGKISYRTFYHLLAEGETTRPGVTWEEEVEQIRLEEEEDLLRREEEVEQARTDRDAELETA